MDKRMDVLDYLEAVALRLRVFALCTDLSKVFELRGKFKIRFGRGVALKIWHSYWVQNGSGDGVHVMRLCRHGRVLIEFKGRPVLFSDLHKITLEAMESLIWLDGLVGGMLDSLSVEAEIMAALEREREQDTRDYLAGLSEVI